MNKEEFVAELEKNIPEQSAWWNNRKITCKLSKEFMEEFDKCCFHDYNIETMQLIKNRTMRHETIDIQLVLQDLQGNLIGLIFKDVVQYWVDMDFVKMSYSEIGDIIRCRFTEFRKDLLCFEFIFDSDSPVKIVFHEIEYITSEELAEE